MASQASLRLPWREPRKLNLLLALTASCLGLFFYFNGPKMLFDHSASSRNVARTGAQAPSDNEIYMGSFVVVSYGSSECWRLLFDNRTGRTWGGGYFDCNAVTETNENRGRRVAKFQHMRAVSTGFQR